MTQALGRTLHAVCRQFDSLALVCEHQEMRYSQLGELADKVAALLRAAGLETDEPVHVMVSNQPFDIAAMLGVWLAGGVVVAVHRSSPAAVTAALEQRTGARFRVDLRSQSVDTSALSLLSTTPPPRRALLHDAALVIFTSGSTGEPKGVVITHGAFLCKLQQIQSLLHFGADDCVLLV